MTPQDFARYEREARSLWRAPSSTLDLLSAPPRKFRWQDLALCAETDPDAFFPELGDSAESAKRVCAKCDVRAECLEEALANRERFGIWGGLGPNARAKLAKRREADVGAGVAA